MNDAPVPAHSVIKTKLESAKSALEALTSARGDLHNAIQPVLTPESPSDPDTTAERPDAPPQSDISDDLDTIIRWIDNERRIIRALLARVEA